VVYSQNSQVKIEVSPVMRGTVHPCRDLEMSDAAKEQFGFVSMQVVSFADLYAGKICAALDRQNPRDLFDIDLLLKNEGIDENTWKTFLVYLISDNRPIADLLAPKQPAFEPAAVSEFQQMASHQVSAKMLEKARQDLVLGIHSQMTDEQKQFLISFKKGHPQWNLLNLP
jgi:predicted nucleotidyltransferase component of viral defense system